ncbi:hypothetical protein ACFFQW_11110 [Umezawaea endophytica]|uniref:Uncharacterized protein n=1 Tax=Umezawaea endophytica TaxID=1654476 RepID=A0A9X2VJZ5_9PSEU|nr:hypothetical protein [Umezawaea endophytica]MCS7478053.1 hypothetical protein [Umezawaea endophytica]
MPLTPPVPIGTGVSLLFALYAGVPLASRWPNSTPPLATWSVRPSPLTSEKYRSVRVVVETWLSCAATPM